MEILAQNQSYMDETKNKTDEVDEEIVEEIDGPNSSKKVKLSEENNEFEFIKSKTGLLSLST